MWHDTCGMMQSADAATGMQQKLQTEGVVMRIRFGLLTAVMMLLMLLLLIASEFWHEQPEVQQAPTLPLAVSPAPVSPATMVPVRVAALPPSPLPKVVATVPAQRCETSQVSGSHTARAEWEARQGALEDVADVCPAGKVTPGQMSCTTVDGAQGILGYAAVKCVQQAACTLCGENLARMHEVAQAAAQSLTQSATQSAPQSAPNSGRVSAR